MFGGKKVGKPIVVFEFSMTFCLEILKFQKYFIYILLIILYIEFLLYLMFFSILYSPAPSAFIFIFLSLSKVYFSLV